jgi:hypothetical protein
MRQNASTNAGTVATDRITKDVELTETMANNKIKPRRTVIYLL